MTIHSTLNIGSFYSKKELEPLLNEPNLGIVREGIYYSKNESSCLFFVDLDKSGKETRFKFNDYFEGEYFHWDSQTTQHIDTPKIVDIISGNLTPHLFVRVRQKVKSVTQPFIYCGRLEYVEFDKTTSKPVHILFKNIDYDDYTTNDSLIEIYLWNPTAKGKETSNILTRRGQVSIERKKKYSKPDKTERRGLVTSRVGQGFYRNEILSKWGGTCPVTGCDVKEILISSHIKKWSKCTDEERLDVENGILLSPDVDSLFDKNLISFNDDGEIICSDKIDNSILIQLGIDPSVKISITDGMKKYLEFHRMNLI